MGNIKLGLQISPTNSLSHQPLLTINGGDWQRNSCGDMRTIIKEIEIYDKPFIWVTFQGKDGYTIAVVMPFGKNDNTTAFIHVPAKAKITGRELKHFVEEVKKVICSKAASPDMSNLETLFSKGYDEKEVASPAIAGIKSKENGPLAYRIYNGTGTGYNLYDLIDKLSQTYYANYRGVFFIDKSYGIEVGKGKGEDLSGKDLLSTIIINVPEEQDGFTSERHGYFELTEGVSYITTYKKKGYKDISKTYTAKRGDDEKVPSDLIIADTEKFIEVKLSDITVYDRETCKPISASITIEYAGGEIRFKNGVSYIPETAFLHGGITIRAKAEGYEEDSKQKSKKEDLLLQRLRFDLKPDWQHKSEPFPEIEIKKQRVKGIRLSYDTHDRTIQAEDVINELCKTYKHESKQPAPIKGPSKSHGLKWKGFVVGCIVGCIVGCSIMFLLDNYRLDKLKAENKQLITQKDEIGTENARLRTEIDKLKKSGASSTELAKLKEENKELRTEIDKLKKSGASSTELAKLKEENKELRTEIDKLKKKLDKFQKR